MGYVAFFVICFIYGLTRPQRHTTHTLDVCAALLTIALCLRQVTSHGDLASFVWFCAYLFAVFLCGIAAGRAGKALAGCPARR